MASVFKSSYSVTLSCLVLLVATPLLAAVSTSVRVNSIGYLPNNVKRGSIVNAAADTTWNLRLASDNSIAATGTLSAAVTDTDTGEAIKTADFTSYTGTGTFYLEIPGLGQSVNFDIQPSVYNNPLAISMLGYYGARCGTAVSFTYGSDTFSHPACHTSDGFLDLLGQTGVQRDGMDGWHDAGDYNKYMVNAGISVGCLLQAWEDFQPNLNTIPLTWIPEHGGAIPDYLAEVKWELNWVLKMQYSSTDGRVADKLSESTFDAFEMPQADTGPRYFTPYSTAATADMVAMLAKAARLYAPYDAAFAAQCQAAAAVSWAYLTSTATTNVTSSNELSTGNYSTDDGVIRLWAAAEMWELTGDPTILADLETRINAQTPLCDNDWDWNDQKNLGIFVYAKSARTGRNAALVTAVDNAIKAAADARVAGRNASGYGRTLKANYYWGSNGSIGRSAMVLHAADLLFPSSNYMDTAVDQLGHLFGRNYYDRSMVTGLGVNPPLNPHHRPSGSDGITNPWPGYLVGGAGGLNGTATDWVDVEADYQVNEVAINWNAGLVYNLAMCSEPFGPLPTNTVSPTPSMTPTPLPCGTPLVIQRMRAESTPYTDGSGNAWAADQAYVAGSWGYVGGTLAAPYAGAISGTTDAGLYQGERYGNPLEYNFTVPNGLFLVDFKTSENYHTAAGQRIFSIQAEGITEVSDLDIYALVGPNTALDITFTVGVSDGVLNIVCPASVDQAHVSAISVTQLFSGPCGTATATLTPSHSPSPSATPTRTPTPSPSLTATRTMTPSASPSATPSRTATISPSASSSLTPSASPTASPSATRSATGSLTLSASPSQTLNATITVSPSATASQTSVPPGSTLTDTPTPSDTFTLSPSYSATRTISPSPSATPTRSPSPSRTASATVTASGSASASPSPSLTVTAVPDTSTATRTSSATLSATPSVVVSGTSTWTVTLTATPTLTVTNGAAASTATITIVPSLAPSGDPKVLQSMPVPQPQSGPRYTFALLIGGGVADSIDIKVYSRAYACVSSQRISGHFGPGWSPVSVDVPGLANGSYFTRIRAGVGGNLESTGKAGRLVVIR